MSMWVELCFEKEETFAHSLENSREGQKERRHSVLWGLRKIPRSSAAPVPAVPALGFGLAGRTDAESSPAQMLPLPRGSQDAGSPTASRMIPVPGICHRTQSRYTSRVWRLQGTSRAAPLTGWIRVQKLLPQNSRLGVSRLRLCTCPRALVQGP